MIDLAMVAGVALVADFVLFFVLDLRWKRKMEKDRKRHQKKWMQKGL